MKARTKSSLLLLGTLVMGLGVGALATGAVMNTRLDQLKRLRSPGGFTERMEEVIQPTDEAQRAEIRAVLDRSHERFHTAWKECGTRFTALGDSMRAELEPLLTPEQQTRFNEWMERDRKQRHERDKRRSRSGHPDRTPPSNQ